MGNIYKELYDAQRYGDDWTASNIRDRIRSLEEAASWNNTTVEALLNDDWKFSGGA